MRDDLDRLRDIRQAIDRIFSRTSSGVVAFRQDEMLQVWVLHHLQIIGEAARALSSGYPRTASGQSVETSYGYAKHSRASLF
jgi:uncharacterized protein with HEPN domain